MPLVRKTRFRLAGKRFAVKQTRVLETTRFRPAKNESICEERLAGKHKMIPTNDEEIRVRLARERFAVKQENTKQKKIANTKATPPCEVKARRRPARKRFALKTKKKHAKQ